jgi:hypothetical protein
MIEPKRRADFQHTSSLRPAIPDCRKSTAFIFQTDLPKKVKGTDIQ